MKTFKSYIFEFIKMYQELDFWLQIETKLDDTGEFKWFHVLEKENIKTTYEYWKIYLPQHQRYYYNSY